MSFSLNGLSVLCTDYPDTYELYLAANDLNQEISKLNDRYKSNFWRNNSVQEKSRIAEGKFITYSLTQGKVKPDCDDKCIKAIIGLRKKIHEKHIMVFFHGGYKRGSTSATENSVDGALSAISLFTRAWKGPADPARSIVTLRHPDELPKEREDLNL